jgi:hypothetical protein
VGRYFAAAINAIEPHHYAQIKRLSMLQTEVPIKYQLRSK